MPTFRIKDIFRITDGGHVLSGYVDTKEVILTGDKVLITVDHEAIVTRIIGVSVEKEDGHLGLLISFTDYDKLKDIDSKGKDVSEWMDKNYWWWTVYDMLNDDVTIDSINNYNSIFVGGEIARQKQRNSEDFFCIFYFGVPPRLIISINKTLR